MLAHIEPLTAVIRLLPTDQYGDPYTWAATLRWLDRETVEICGAMRAPTLAEYRAMLSACKPWGVTKIMYERKCGANPRRVERQLSGDR